MTAKEYLEQIKRYNLTMQNKLSELYQLKTMASSISIVNGERVQSSGNKDKLGGTVAKIVDLEAEINESVIDLYKKRQVVIRQMEQMKNPDHYNILFNRYCRCRELSDIANDMGYSYRQITRKHGEALAEFDRLYSKEYSDVKI